MFGRLGGLIRKRRSLPQASSFSGDEAAADTLADGFVIVRNEKPATTEWYCDLSSSTLYTVSTVQTELNSVLNKYKSVFQLGWEKGRVQKKLSTI